MQVTKVIGIIVVVAAIGLGAGFGWKALSKKDSNTGKSNTDTGNSLEVPGTDEDFAWGATILAFPFPRYQESFSIDQMKEAKNLGLNYARIEYEPVNPQATEVLVNSAKDNGMKVVLVIPFQQKDIFTDKSLEKTTTDHVTSVVNRFKGKVAVYQLATEVASVALANNAALHGIEKKDYPADKLAAVTTWVKTASSTVKKIDPSAKRLVNDQWVHTGFFDNYFSAGGDFDILGWNWFSDMGNSMDTVTIDKSKNQNYQLLNKLKSYNKPIWLTEVNRRLGSQGGNEKAQADFITTMAEYATKQPQIKGFFVYNFFENQVAPEKERGYSLVNAADTNNQQKITGKKPAFDAFKKAIQNSR